MKVILLKNIENLGQKNDIKDVSDGYARNFLFPQKMAVVATERGIKFLEEKIKKEKMELEGIRQKAFLIAKTINDSKIFFSKEAKNGRLFGSITANNISEKLKKRGLDIFPNQIIIKKAIKTIGDHEVEIDVFKNIKANLKLTVEEK